MRRGPGLFPGPLYFRRTTTSLLPMTQTPADTPRDRNGFPLTRCPRCSGTGLMPFSYKGGTCFKCIGSGWVHATKATAARADEYAAAVKAARNCRTAELQPGDVVNVSGRKGYQTVRSAQLTDLYCGSTAIGTPGTPGYTFTLHHKVQVIWEDGTADYLGSVNLTRKADVDPAPYLARLPKKWRP